MEIIRKFSKTGKSIDIYGSYENPLFKAQQIGEVLGFGNIHSSLSNVRKEWKVTKLQNLENGKPPVKTSYLTESGLYYLLMRSNKKEAQDFQIWICEDVIPTIRKTGEYKMNHKYSKKLTFNIQNEDDLHSKVVQFIKKRFPNSLFTTTLGEMQDTSQKRLKAWRLGYLAGSPDLVINNLNKKYTGFAIEFKSPTGKGCASDAQVKMLKKYDQNGFKTLISNDYDEIVEQVLEYFKDVRIACKYCSRRFKDENSLLCHHKGFHKIE